MKTNFNRRKFLRCSAGGAGTIVGLPLLESMFGSSQAYAAANLDKPRFFSFYVPNGIIEENWFPDSGSKTNFDLSGTALEAFQEKGLKNDISLYRGMTNTGDKGSGNAHMKAIAGFLTGHAIPNDRIAKHKVSFDQHLANYYRNEGSGTRLHSLQLAGNPELDSPLNNDYNNRLKNSLSFSDDGTILNNTANLKAVYDRLFSGTNDGSSGQDANRRSLLKLSVLDQVKEDRDNIAKFLSAEDKSRLDQYYTSLRDLEQELDAEVSMPPEPGTCVAPNVNPPQLNDSQRNNSIGDHARIMAKMIAVAFSCDITRSVTYMAGGEAAGCSYEDIDIDEHFHNSISHNRDGKKDKWSKIDKFHGDLVANVMEELKKTQNGTGTLLDGTGILFGSGLGNGSAHQGTNIALMVGGNIGQWEHGRYHQIPNDDRYHARLLNTFNKEMGLPGSFGDLPNEYVPIS